ncbi:MAG: lytic transglycosylase domain-containing protein [candidate division KSB1 bacterium]|nr:lytic transglycosylase domain-containing protein [candidate division KSB1 bacterium]MDZ7304265.1 lytic transglycosylase domain-containing protein [candidate division KSB1 bacterium]MDZ7312881.1 lytic transglycosylase domain-containing protein [candidate division KSB1 bacterium]
MLKGDKLGEKFAGLRASRVIKIVFLVIFCLAAIGFSFRYLSIYNAQEGKINELERALHDLRAAMNVDSVRQYSIQKIIAIINRFNPAMDSATKYEIANTIYEMSIKYPNLDIDLICATITHESSRSWNPEVVSQAGAMGLMQIMPTTGMYIAQYEGIIWSSPEDVLFNPVYNIRIGCRYLSSLISEYDVDGGLAAYNGGERRASLWIRKDRAAGILWSETSSYIPSVLNLYKEYREMTPAL